METIEISLPQMLDARERRAHHQLDLLHQYQKPLLCFTMNIAGPIKNSDLILRGFLTGVEDMKLQLKKTMPRFYLRKFYKIPLGMKVILSLILTLLPSNHSPVNWKILMNLVAYMIWMFSSPRDESSIWAKN